MSAQKLVSICVPTYNRADDLDRCLGSILSQVDELKDFVEVYVSNNASTDNTKDIIDKYVREGYPLNVLESSVNVGLDRNLQISYEAARTPYIWIFGDDDYLMPGMMKPIVDILRSGSYGIVYLPSRWYQGDFKINNTEYTQFEKFSYTIILDTINYLSRTHYWITFITGNIVNKGLIQDKIKVDIFDGTIMSHLAWVMPALFAGSNVIVEVECLICKSTERGGYKLFESFGPKFSKILSHFVPKHGSKFKRVIESNMIKSFFPQFIQNGPIFESENYFKLLFPIYWRYPSFWKMMAHAHIDATKRLLKG